MLKRSFLFVPFCLLISFLFFFSTAHADGSDVAVAPVYPSNQISPNGIFDLKVSPGQIQTIHLKVVNLSKFTNSITVEPTTAYTSDSGLLAIDKVHAPESKRLQISFRKIVNKSDLKQHITLSPNKVKIISITFRVPNKPFTGVTVGGLLVKSNNSENQGTGKGINLRNKFAYTMSVVLKEQKKVAQPRLTIGSVKPGKMDSNIIVNSVFNNVEPAVISDMKMTATITKISNGKQMGKTSANGLSVAPSSSYKYMNNWDSNNIFPGKYHYKAVFVTADGHHWTLEKDFNVNVLDSLALNNRNNPWIWYLIILLIILILILILWYLIRKKLREKREEN